MKTDTGGQAFPKIKPTFTINFSLEWWRWVCGWAQILDGIVLALTLGIVHPDFSYCAATILARRRAEKRRRENDL